MNSNKILAALAASLIWVGYANAADIGSTGISVGMEAVAEYNIDSEVSVLTIEPELGYDLMGWMDLTASTKMSVYDGTDWIWSDSFEPTLNMKASREVMADVSVYAKTGYSLETDDMTDIVVGAKWNW